MTYPGVHHLRHFAATTLLETGEDLSTVSRILGRVDNDNGQSVYG